MNRPPCLAASFTSVLMFAFLVMGPSGCGKQPAKKEGVPEVKLKENAEDSLGTAMKLLKQATEIGHYRDALNLANEYLTRIDGGEERKEPAVRELKDDQRAFLESNLALNSTQLKYVGESTFQPADAFYLEEAFLFRDAAQWLDVTGERPPSMTKQNHQIAHVLRWVTQHVLLHEQADEHLPPQFVLKRGYGSVRDRALILLHLLRHFELGGAILEVAEKEDPVVLVGILNGEGVALYDPRLGTPVLDAKGNVANWSDVLKDPSPLKAHGIPALAEDKARWRLAPSLGSLAPRMQYLEGRLITHVRVTLYQDVFKLRDDFESAGVKVEAWDVKDASVVPPTHLLARFLPAKEAGGLDDTNRLGFFSARQFPQQEIRLRLAAMGLAAPEIPQEAVEQLVVLARELFTRFVFQPRDMLLRGRPEDAISRLNRIMRALEEFDERSETKNEATFKKRLSTWRNAINESYTAALKKKGAELRVWTDDKYFAAFMDLERDNPPSMAYFAKEKDGNLMLTLVLFNACRRAAGEETQFLISQCFQDVAERRQSLNLAALAAKKETKASREQAHQAWKTARYHWGAFNERHGRSLADLKAVREELEQRWQAGQQRECLLALEQVLLELHRNLYARYEQTQAGLMLGESKTSLARWKSLQADVSAILEDKDWINLMERFRKEAFEPALARAFSFLARDWSPRGGLATWRQLLQDEPASK